MSAAVEPPQTIVYVVESARSRDVVAAYFDEARAREVCEIVAEEVRTFANRIAKSTDYSIEVVAPEYQVRAIAVTS